MKTANTATPWVSRTPNWGKPWRGWRGQMTMDIEAQALLVSLMMSVTILFESLAWGLAGYLLYVFIGKTKRMFGIVFGVTVGKLVESSAYDYVFGVGQMAVGFALAHFFLRHRDVREPKIS